MGVGFIYGDWQQADARTTERMTPEMPLGEVNARMLEQHRTNS